MKIQSTTLLASLDATQMASLTHQVKETLAINHRPEKIFTSANLWNIQRQRKTFNRRTFA